MNPRTCPDCGARMIATHSRRMVRLSKRYRTCTGCGRHDVAVVETRIISVQLVRKHTNRVAK